MTENKTTIYTPKVLTGLIVAMAAIVVIASCVAIADDNVGWSLFILMPIWAVMTVALLAAAIAGLTGHVETGFWLALGGPAFLVFLVLSANIQFIYPVLAILLLVWIIKMIIKKDKSRALLWIAIILELFLIWSLVGMLGLM